MKFQEVISNLGEQKTSMGREFKLLDVSVEEWREYQFPNGSVYRIQNPIAVAIVGENNSHRVIDEFGFTHYPKSNWIALKWSVRNGQKLFIA